ncbi:MAG: fibronectin type III domain-containing protein [Nitrosopumilaceae archaeon]
MIFAILPYVEGQSGPTVPNAPTLTATVISSSQINLSWTTPSNGGSSITGYKIEYKIIPAGYSLLVQINGNTTTTYSHTGLQSDKYYVYRIFAINSVGTSEASAETIGHTQQPQNIVPNPPTGLNVKAVSPTKINLFWNAPSNNGGPLVSGYKIEEKAGTGSYTIVVANTGNANTSYPRTGLTTGTAYTYRVSAINSVGTGSASNEDSDTPTASSAATVPTPSSNLTATKISQTQINLAWVAPLDNGGELVTGYKIEEKVGTGSYSVVVANTGNTNTAYSRTGLTAGQTYTYRVSAINSVGASNPSNEASATQTLSIVPNAPTGLQATSASTTQINLSWNPPSNNGGPAVTSYKIEFRIGGGSYSTLANTAATSYSHTGLTTGTTYTYRVSAINSVGTSATSNEASAVPSKTYVPTGLTAIAVSPTQINLSWIAPSETYGQSITGYKIERVVAAGTYVTVVENTGKATTYSVTGLTTGTTYTFVVSGHFSMGGTARSNEASATPTSTSAPPPTPSPATTVPNSPSGLTATTVSPTQINLSWTAPSNNGGSVITGYKIEEKNGTGTYSVLVANTGNTNTSYSRSGLTTGVTYTYRVSAINSIGTGNQSGEDSATTTAPTPSPTPTPKPTPTPAPTPSPPTTPSSSIGRVKVENTDFALRYEITGGEVLGTEVDVETNSLLIEVDATNDGVLTIPLPRTLIDAKTNQNADDVFYVLVDGKEASFTETTTSNSGTLAIDVPDGTTEITIYGTQVVPEFGALASLVLIICIVSIVIITKVRTITKY